jgi:hypothetical protein
MRAGRLFLLFTIVSLVSCQKEVDLQPGVGSGTGSGGGGNTNSIIGDYDFVGMVAHTQSTVTVSDQGQQLKAVTVTDYVTKNNVGTAKFTSSDFIGTGIGYSIDTMMNLKTYIDNVLFDDSNLPYAVTSPPANSTSPYVRVNADSITITGAIGAPTGLSGSTPTGPVGLKLSWSGDTLLLKINSTFTQNVTQNGVPGMLSGTVVGVTKLKKR